MTSHAENLKLVADAIRQGALGLMKIKGDYSRFDGEGGDDVLEGVCAQGALCRGAGNADLYLSFPLMATEKLAGRNYVDESLRHTVLCLATLNDETDLSFEEMAQLVEQDKVLTHPSVQEAYSTLLIQEADNE